MNQTLILRRLTRTPKYSDHDELRFQPGVNVMVGDKDSGKTTWLRMLDYVLGDDDKPALAFGEGVAATYHTIEAEFALGDKALTLQRSWSADAAKTKMLLDGAAISVADLSDLLLTKLGIPRLNFPKGDPFSERKWPALSFRTLLRHIYRQERFWSDWADKQPESEQHACLALFLGVAEALFPPKYGELVRKQKELDQLTLTREAHQKLLDQIAADLLRQKEITVAVTDASIAATEERLREDLASVEKERGTLLTAVAEKAEAKISAYAMAAKAQLDRLLESKGVLDAENHQVTHRLTELRSYSQMLAEELQRFGRADSVNQLVAQLKVTHCPVCDQEITPARLGSDCYLCHRPTRPPPPASGKNRVAFEEAQLKEECEEIGPLITELESKLKDVQERLEQNVAQCTQLENDLRPARQIAAGFLPPDLALFDQRRGRIQEQLDTLARVKKSVASQKQLTEQIDRLVSEEAKLKAELAEVKADADLQRVSQLFEDRINDYFNQINAGDSSRWTHRRAIFLLKPRRFELRADEKLGATSQALFLFAYHYALLSLSAEAKCFYPGLAIIDFPLRLADGATIRDKENYLIEPFIKLCSRPEMRQSQLIAAGQSFENLKGAHIVPVARDAKAK